MSDRYRSPLNNVSFTRENVVHHKQDQYLEVQQEMRQQLEHNYMFSEKEFLHREMNTEPTPPTQEVNQEEISATCVTKVAFVNSKSSE